MTTAIYAFSGDPITFGHIDIIKRTAKVFDKVVVGIGINPSKNYLFTLEERFSLAKKALARLDNVKVVSFSGLLVDFAYENDIDVIVKGIRNSADFDYENILHQVGDSQKLGIDTFILFARPELAHVSSSAVKSIQKEQGFVHDYVTLEVKQEIERKISNQYILGVTGEIGSGKSFICEQILKLCKEKGVEAHNIELDHISHKILSELKDEKYEKIRNQLIKTFGMKIKKQDGTIDRKILGEIVFNNNEKLKQLNEIMYTPILVRLRKEIYGKKGLIIINAALIAESNLTFLSNNNTLIIKVDKDTQKQRLLSRELTIEQINRRLNSQLNYTQKKKSLEEAIKKYNHGKLWIYDNSVDYNENKDNLNKIVDDIIKELKIK